MSENNVLYVIETTCLLDYHVQTVHGLKRKGVKILLYAMDSTIILNRSILDFYRKEGFPLADFSKYFGPDTYLDFRGRLKEDVLTDGYYDPSKWANQEEFKEGVERIRSGWELGHKTAIIHSGATLFEEALQKAGIKVECMPKLSIGGKH